MIYKKYAIEIVYVDSVIENVEINTINEYNSVNLKLNNIRKPYNTIKYLDYYGNINDVITTFYTYEKAYDVLDRNYKYINENHAYRLISVKIVECYDNNEPPFHIMRMLKIKKIKQQINEKFC